MLLGGSAGVKIMQSIWRVLGVDIGEVSIAVPIGGAVGALAGALLGLISNPRLLVLLMAVFAGSAAGGVSGRIPWGEIGEIGGQVAGGDAAAKKLDELKEAGAGRWEKVKESVGNALDDLKKVFE
jgi:hypothetical protein